MVHAMPDDFTQPSTESLARLILACAEDDPTLVRRSRARGRAMQKREDDTPTTQRAPLPSLALASHSSLSSTQQLEELVSLAVTSAQEAEYALQRTHAAGKRMRRGMWLFAGVSAVGMMAGVAGMIDYRFNAAVSSQAAETVRPAAVAIAERPEIVAPPVEASRPPPVQQAIDTNPPEMAVAEPTVTAASVPVRQTPLVPPLNTLRSTNYPQPWPTSPRPIRSIPVVQHNQVVLPGFVIALQRNIGALFR
jgi:hypothetical protein